MKKYFLITMLMFILMAPPCYATDYQNQMYSNVQGDIQIVAAIVYPLQGMCVLGDNADHTPLTITSASYDRGGIWLDYPLISKVIHIGITPDDALLKAGYIVAGSQSGLNGTLFYIGKLFNIYGGANYSNGQWYLNYTSPDYMYSLEDRGNGVIRINHTGDAGLIPIMLTGRLDSYTPKIGLFASNYFDVLFYDSQGNQVTQFDAKCNFLFNRSGYRVIDASTETFPAGGNFWIYGVMLK